MSHKELTEKTTQNEVELASAKRAFLQIRGIDLSEVDDDLVLLDLPVETILELQEIRETVDADDFAENRRQGIANNPDLIIDFTAFKKAANG